MSLRRGGQKIPDGSLAHIHWLTQAPLSSALSKGGKGVLCVRPVEVSRVPINMNKQAKKELRKLKGKRVAGILRPQHPGDLCWKCGDVTRFQETKTEPKPHQTYAYLGYLVCSGCGTMYLCEHYKYTMDDRPGLFTHF